VRIAIVLLLVMCPKLLTYGEMNTTGHLRWLRAALLVGVLYLVAGLVFAALAKSAASNQVRVAWRLAAWLISAAGFATHIGYEQIRLRSSPRITALHVCLAVGLGAFGLAVAATLHARETQQHFPAAALAIWPVMTALPAFVVALAAAALLKRARRRESTT
jgi:vacuolar-type H+-ATPase subunit I/STV1